MANIKSALAELRKFCIALSGQLNSTLGNSFEFPGRSVSDAELGGFTLSADEGLEYRRVFEVLRDVMMGKLSDAALDRSIDRAILRTLDGLGLVPNTTPEFRAGEAIRELETILTAPASSWVNLIPLSGITAPTEPWEIGDVVIFDLSHAYGQELVMRAEKIIQAGTDPEKTKEWSRQHLHRSIESHPGKTFAAVTSSALDATAAWTSAKGRLRFVLNCLNFILDMIQGPTLRHEISDDPMGRPHRTGLTIECTNWTSMEIQNEMGDATHLTNADELRKTIGEEPSLVRFVEMLATPSPNGHQRRVLAAAQWAGRASVERRPEEAFLRRAIALESFILGRTDSEITTRLAYSTVHLLGPWLISREQSVKQIKSLYSIRSKIVHSGSYNVIPSDLALLRGYVHRVFRRVLGHEPFMSMQAEDELDRWFDAALRGERNHSQET